MEKLTEFWKKLSHKVIFYPQASLSIAGYSHLDRPVPLVKISNDSGLSPGETKPGNEKLNILICAGQHGDEPATVDLALELISKFNNQQFSRFLDQFTIFLLPLANPDGFAADQRNNNKGIDLNRDHQLLQAPETKVIHQVFRECKADVVIDLHTYPARRQNWLDQGLIKPYDVMLDTTTHPNASTAVQKFALTTLLPIVKDLLEYNNFYCRRYFIGGPSPKRIRNSTPDVHDLRNAAGLYQSLSILLEFRHAYKPGGKRYVRSLKAASLALDTTLQIIAQHAFELRLLIDQERNEVASGQRKVHLWARYRNSEKKIEMKSIENRQMVTIPVNRFSDRVEPTESVPMPDGYLVPVRNKKLIGLLNKHGVSLSRPQPAKFDCYEIKELIPSRKKNRPPRKMDWEVVNCEITPADNYVSIACNDWNAMMLGVFLEPRSKYGLSRFPELALNLHAGTLYPVIRFSLY